MKKSLLFGLPLLLIVAISCAKDNGELSGDDIIEFRDPFFFQALLTPRNIEIYDPDTDDKVLYSMNIDANMDGKISVNEAKSVKGIELPGWLEISEMTEIKYFTSLISLDIGGAGRLNSLDVSKNTALKYLYGANEGITELNIGKNHALKRLDCYKNCLTTLDVSGCPNLTTLFCNNNKLTTLDVSGCTELEYLGCGNNQLEKIRVNVKNKLSQYVLDEYADIIEWVK